jgi:hypothetical protein
MLASMTQPALAAPQNRQGVVKLRKSHKTCQQAIRFVEGDLRRRGYFSRRRLDNVLETIVVTPRSYTKVNAVPANYYDYPANRTDSVTFLVTDNPKNSIFNFFASKQLIASLSAEVIGACNKVGVINFEYLIEQEVETSLVGYFADGTVRTFLTPDGGGTDCGELERFERTVNTSSGSRTVMKWGYSLGGVGQCL